MDGRRSWRESWTENEFRVEGKRTKAKRNWFSVAVQMCNLQKKNKNLLAIDLMKTHLSLAVLSLKHIQPTSQFLNILLCSFSRLFRLASFSFPNFGCGDIARFRSRRTQACICASSQGLSRSHLVKGQKTTGDMNRPPFLVKVFALHKFVNFLHFFLNYRSPVWTAIFGEHNKLPLYGFLKLLSSSIASLVPSTTAKLFQFTKMIFLEYRFAFACWAKIGRIGRQGMI